MKFCIAAASTLIKIIRLMAKAVVILMLLFTAHLTAGEIALEVFRAVGIQYFADPNQVYKIERSTDLDSWTMVEEGITGTGLISRYYPSDASAFYRVSSEETNFPPVITTEILLPPKIYAVTGRELNIYFDNVVLSDRRDLKFKVESLRGQQYKKFWRWTPTDKDPSPVLVTIKAFDPSGRLLASRLTRVFISKPRALDFTLFTIGDSTISNGRILSELMNLSGPDLMTLGPYTIDQSDSTGVKRHVNFCAVNGKTTEYFDVDPASPVAQSISPADWVLTHLGINDIFGPTSDEEALEQVESSVAHLASIAGKARSAGARVAIGLTIPPAATQDAFGKVYGTQQSRDRYKRNRDILVSRVLAQFGTGEANQIYLVPTHVGIDPENSFPTEETQNSARDTRTVWRQSDAVHPAPVGYWQVTDMIYAFFCGQ